MNIAYILSDLRNSGGMERIICDKANALAAVPGVRVYIACVQERKDSVPPSYFPLDRRVTATGCGIRLQNGSLFSLPFRWLAWRRRIHRAVKDFVRTHAIDITISTTYDIVTGYDSGGVPHIFESHAARAETDALSVFPSVRHFLSKLHVRRAAAIVALTDADNAGWPEARRRKTIGNFTCIRPVAPYNPDTKRVMAAGRYVRQKGFDILIEAWRTVSKSHPDWTLDIYGDSPENRSGRDSLRDIIDAHGLSASVNVHCRSDNMAATLAEHSVFVLSSRFEGFGLVLLEAMRCGLPVVSFDCPHGPSDIITDGADGMLVPFKGLSDSARASALAGALDRIMSDRDMRCRFSCAASAKAGTFSREAIISRWTELFNEIAAK